MTRIKEPVQMDLLTSTMLSQGFPAEVVEPPFCHRLLAVRCGHLMAQVSSFLLGLTIGRVPLPTLTYLKFQGLHRVQVCRPFRREIAREQADES